MHLLQPYLPPTEVSASDLGSGYAQGGALYALGLIHARPGLASTVLTKTREYLLQQLHVHHRVNEIVAHGASLGVGLVHFGTADPVAVLALKEVLDTDSAIAGEAAGISLGLVLAGRTVPPALQEVVDEMRNYARETSHEKIIRGIGMGLALMQLGLQDAADATIQDMSNDRDPILRYGAQYATGLAYCGTGSNKAVRILLHTAVSDVSDDVRMAAVINLALVLFRTPTRVPQLVSLLLESFHPHVRYASCMAVGIAMAGTGDVASAALLEPMLDDMVDYVRQGALIGLALLYMQCGTMSKLRQFRERLSTILSEKHQSGLTKMGAIMATGILDAGGRNVGLQLEQNGIINPSAVVGLVLWLQYWHWFPLSHLFSLCVSPTFLIGLVSSGQYPKSFAVTCHAKPSAFAYPKPLQEKREEQKKRVETVTLSVTAKEKARLARKRKEDGGDEGKDEGKADDETKKEEAKKDGKDAMEEEKKKKEPEPTSFVVSNPSRVTKAQALVCTFDASSRYRPVRPSCQGVVLLEDTQPMDESDLQELQSPMDQPEGELPPPEGFLWTPPTADDAMGEANDDSKDEDAKMEEAKQD